MSEKLPAENWVTVADDRVRHRWKCPGNGDDEPCENAAVVQSDWYSANGTPYCGACERDMEYLSTEMLQPATELFTHYEAGEKSPHTALRVVLRPHHRISFRQAFEQAVHYARKINPDEWTNTDVYDRLKSLGWQFEILNLQDAKSVDS